MSTISLIRPVGIVCVMVMFTACGGGGGGAAPATDTTAPTVVAATPANGASSVSRIADLTFRVSEPLNAASVTGTNVRLTYKNINGRDEVLASVSYDAATKTITVNPSQPLSPATTYTLTLANIQDAAGNTMPSTAIAFKTYVNPFMKDVFYTATGVDVDHYAEYIYDANGNRTRSVGFTAAGVVNGHEDYIYNGDGSRARSLAYTAAGVLDGYEDYRYAANGDQTRTDVYTAAHVLDGYKTYSYDANGNRTGTLVYTAAGVLDGYETYSYAANGNLMSTDVYTAAGGVVKSYTYEYDANGNQTRSVALTGGVVDNYYTYIYDSNGNNTALHNYTGNHVEAGNGTFSYAANGNRKEYLGYVGGVLRYRSSYDPAL